MVIAFLMANYVMKKILVTLGNSVDILIYDAFEWL